MYPVGAELFHVCGQKDIQTDVTKLIVVFEIIWTSLQTELTEIYCDDVGRLNLPNIE